MRRQGGFNHRFDQQNRYDPNAAQSTSWLKTNHLFVKNPATGNVEDDTKCTRCLERADKCTRQCSADPAREAERLRAETQRLREELEMLKMKPTENKSDNLTVSLRRAREEEKVE